MLPPEIKFVPLAEAINKVRTVSADNEFLKIANSLGIYYGIRENKMMTTQTTNLLEIQGTVLNIQRFCSHDGPGVRTHRFLERLLFALQMVRQSESIQKKPEISYDPKRCTGKKCSVCLKPPFPEGALLFCGWRRRKSECQLAPGHGLQTRKWPCSVQPVRSKCSAKP